MGRQSDPNEERTLGHVGPTMGGVVTSELRKEKRAWRAQKRQNNSQTSSGHLTIHTTLLAAPEGHQYHEQHPREDNYILYHDEEVGILAQRAESLTINKASINATRTQEIPG